MRRGKKRIVVKCDTDYESCFGTKKRHICDDDHDDSLLLLTRNLSTWSINLVITTNLKDCFRLTQKFCFLGSKFSTSMSTWNFDENLSFIIKSWFQMSWKLVFWVLIDILGHVLVSNDSTTINNECNGEWSKKYFSRHHIDIKNEINIIWKLT